MTGSAAAMCLLTDSGVGTELEPPPGVVLKFHKITPPKFNMEPENTHSGETPRKPLGGGNSQ